MPGPERTRKKKGESGRDEPWRGLKGRAVPFAVFAALATWTVLAVALAGWGLKWESLSPPVQ